MMIMDSKPLCRCNRRSISMAKNETPIESVRRYLREKRTTSANFLANVQLSPCGQRNILTKLFGIASCRIAHSGKRTIGMASGRSGAPRQRGG